MQRMLFKICVLLFVTTSCLSAQPYRSTLKIPPVQIYQALLEYAKEKDYEKIKESLKFIDPIFNTLQKKFGKNIKIEIEEAVNKEDIQITQNSLFRLIFYSMKDTFHSIINKDSKDIDFDVIEKNIVRTRSFDVTKLS